MDSTRKRSKWYVTPVEVLAIALLSLAAQATHFSGKQGRTLPCGDSAQYVASAEALLTGGGTPHFEMRKPGYILYLAAVALLFGNMGWAAAVGNHIFLGLLPLSAYGLGRHLKGRMVGWLAAIVTIARLQFAVWGDRILSEPLFTFLLSFGVLVLVAGVTHRRYWLWMLSAGVLLGLSWLTRGSATPVVFAAGLWLLIVFRRDRRRMAVACVSLALPILGCALVECGLNLKYANTFRPSNGTVGATVLLRARYFEGAALPDTADAQRILSLVPERTAQQAYIADHLDIWVARHRAVHDRGMTEWEYDDLMGRVGGDALMAVLPSYLLSGVRLSVAHLLRDPDGQRFSPVPDTARSSPIIHENALPDIDWYNNWYAYYGTPHLTTVESHALANRMKQAANVKAPFGDSAVWKAFRYWKTEPAAAALLNGLNKLGSLWPGFALIGCGLLGLKRRTCGFLALAYVFEALFIGLLTPTNIRLQFIWLVTDTVLSSGLVVGIVVIAVQYVRNIRKRTYGLAALYRTGRAIG